MPKVEPIGRRVVHIEPDSERISKARLARLPAPVASVREAFQRRLGAMLKSYFERADDSLFDLADKASSNEEQNIYFDSMREVRVRRHGIEGNFARALDEAFGELIDTKAAQRGEEVFDSLKADALSLVHDDDLEEMVAVDSSVARANREFGESIQFISLRLDSLVPVKVYQKNNPVGPDVLCRAFMDELKKLDASLKAKLVLFRLFDKQIIDGLGEVYRHVNEILIEHNVMPSLPGRSAQSSGGTPRRRASDQASSQAEANSVRGEVAAAINNLIGESNQAQVQADLGADFGIPSSGVSGGAGVPAGAVSDVLSLLTMAQRQAQQANVIHRSKDVRNLIKQMSVQSSEQVVFGRVEDQVMNLVNMLFDFILEDRNLAAAMKMLISRMQIPIIKVALADKTFFAKRGHVARKLLNEMSTAAIGWEGNEETAHKDPLFKKMDSIVRKLLEEFDHDVSIFSDLLADFTAFLEKERKRVAILERRTLDAEDGKAKAEVARTTVALEIEVRTQELQLPDSIAQLINDAWSNVLFVTALKHGYHSAEWLSALTTLDELVWSVQEPSDAAGRQKLIKGVPALLKKLRAGLDTISYNPFEMSTLFKALEEVHLKCIRGSSPVRRREAPKPKAPEAKPEPAPKPAPETSSEDVKAAPAEPKAEADDIEEIELSALSPFSAAGGLDSQVSAREPEPEIDAFHMQQVESFVQGAWFDMKDDKDTMMRCRLAAFIKPTRKYIFVNRNGMKVAERTQEDLALALKNKALRPLDNSMMFDRALETVVSSLRKKRD